MDRRRKSTKPKDGSRNRPKLRRSKRTQKKVVSISYQRPLRILSRSRRIAKGPEKTKDGLHSNNKMFVKPTDKPKKAVSIFPVHPTPTKQNLSECTRSERQRQSRMSLLAKRKEERELKRRRRELVEGKRLDQASFTVFNSIEGYFY